MTTIIDARLGFIKPKEQNEILNILDKGGVIVAPNDTGYALLCRLDAKNASVRIRRLRQLDDDHFFTLLCSDLTHLSHYARVDNVQFRLLKTLFPGAFTCILPASREVPRLVQHEKRKTIGIRLPNHPILQPLITAHGAALMGVSLFDDSEINPDVYQLDKAQLNSLDLIIDVGELAVTPSTVLDLTVMPPIIIRHGAGDASFIERNTL